MESVGLLLGIALMGVAVLGFVRMIRQPFPVEAEDASIREAGGAD